VLYFDPTFSFLVLIPAMLLTLYAQNRVQSTYQRYMQRRAESGATGGQVARALLDRAGLGRVPVEISPGRLTDHYDPRRQVLRLSQDNYHTPSVAAVAIAAHEVGHAAQHAEAYAPLAIRNNLVPIASLTSNLAWPLFFFGLILASPALMDVGIWLFVGAVVFQLITLPVEFNASSRAMAMLSDGGFLATQGEAVAARDVLSAAALTYVAALAVAVSTLLRMLILRNSRRR
jgi:Zn-dependent membrane protease YugP